MSAVQAAQSPETDADWKEGPGNELRALLILGLFFGGGVALLVFQILLLFSHQVVSDSL